jgi:hypothetical protein
VTELLKILEILKQRGLEDCIKLLHFHLGSQITNIHNVKNAINEVARIYVELMRAGAGLEYLDVGGGLGIDYDGSQTNFESSVNYTLQEYANDVIFRVKTVCDEAGVKHPTIISESGRATVAYHSVLVFNVLGVSKFYFEDIPEELPEDYPQPIHDLHALCKDVSKKNLLESYHDAVQAYDELINSFNLGYLSLELRSLSERLYYYAAQKILKIVRNLEFVPEELEGLETQLSDTYFCNFSVFQSLPDSWAVQQLFPIMPIHGLRDEPRRRGILADITCDSDGKVDKFIDLRDVKKTLELHDSTHDRATTTSRRSSSARTRRSWGPPQPLRRHELRPRLARRKRKHQRRHGSQGRHRPAGALLRPVLRERAHRAGAERTWSTPSREKRITLEESARFLKFYEQGMGSYTYLTTRPVPAPLSIVLPGHTQERRTQRERQLRGRRRSIGLIPAAATGPHGVEPGRRQALVSSASCRACRSQPQSWTDGAMWAPASARSRAVNTSGRPMTL